MIASHPLLARRPAREAPALTLLPDTDELALIEGRVHEVCGLSRHTFAMWLATKVQGTVIWITPSWAKDRLASDGVSAWIDPGRLLFVTPQRGEDLLWATEEVLRSGAVPLVVADVPDLPGLTQIRRMHLAAETGGQTGYGLPTCLLLTPGQGGAPGVETRWHMAPKHRQGREIWNLERRRARTAPLKSWDIGRTSTHTLCHLKTA